MSEPESPDSKPWTIDEYERLRILVIALVRAMQPVDQPLRPAALGPLLWAVLGALDRERA